MKKLFTKTLITSFSLFITVLFVTPSYAQWMSTTFPTSSMVSAFTISGNNFYAGTFGDGINLSNDNGLNWSPINTGLTNQMITSFTKNGTIIFAGTAGDGIYSTTNNGLNWTAAGFQGKIINCLYYFNSILFAATNTDGIMVSL